jgi:hypothetical protein
MLSKGRVKPFEDTAKYIAFLERSDRAAWQKPDAVVAAFGPPESVKLPRAS